MCGQKGHLKSDLTGVHSKPEVNFDCLRFNEQKSRTKIHLSFTFLDNRSKIGGKSMRKRGK